jgi:hypothetical protein
LLFVLDTNEYIFAFGLLKNPPAAALIDRIVDSFPTCTLRIPRMIVEEVRQNLTPEEFQEFIAFIGALTSIDEDFLVPFEIGVRYEQKGLKPPGAYTEWVGADILATENRHFLTLHANLPFRILTAENCLKLL